LPARFDRAVSFARADLQRRQVQSPPFAKAGLSPPKRARLAAVAQTKQACPSPRPCRRPDQARCSGPGAGVVSGAPVTGASRRRGVSSLSEVLGCGGRRGPEGANAPDPPPRPVAGITRDLRITSFPLCPSLFGEDPTNQSPHSSPGPDSHHRRVLGRPPHAFQRSQDPLRGKKGLDLFRLTRLWL
jgi:hypothetical protein